MGCYVMFITCAHCIIQIRWHIYVFKYLRVLYSEYIQNYIFYAFLKDKYIWYINIIFVSLQISRLKFMAE